MFVQKGLGEMLQDQQQLMSQREMDTLRRKQIQAQIDAQRAKAQLMRDPRYLKGQLPINMRGFEEFEGYDPKKRDRYSEFLAMQPQAKQGIYRDAGTGELRSFANLGGLLGGIDKDKIRTVTPAEVDRQRQLEEAKYQEQLKFQPKITSEVTTAKLTTEDKQQAIQDLPNVLAQTDEILSVLDQIESSEGLSAVVGAPNPLKGGFGAFEVPGTPAANFRTLYERLEGQKFKQAYETLKGGGQITEIESKKATQAIATMSTAQSEKEFSRGLREFKGVIKAARKRAEVKAGVKPTKRGAAKPVTQPQGDTGEEVILLDENFNVIQ